MKLIRRIAKSAPCVYVCVRVAFEIEKKKSSLIKYIHIFRAENKICIQKKRNSKR